MHEIKNERYSTKMNPNWGHIAIIHSSLAVSVFGGAPVPVSPAPVSPHTAQPAQRGPGLRTSNRWSSARRQGRPLDRHPPCHCCCCCCWCCYCCYCCCCWCCWLLVLWWCCRSSPLVPVLLLRWCGHWGPAPGIRHPSSSPVESRPPRGREAPWALLLHQSSHFFLLISINVIVMGPCLLLKGFDSDCKMTLCLSIIIIYVRYHLKFKFFLLMWKFIVVHLNT